MEYRKALYQYHENMSIGKTGDKSGLYIYGIRISEEINTITFNKLLEHISPEKRKRIKRFKFHTDAQRCLLGDLMIRYIICNRFPLKNDDIRFAKNKYGKLEVPELQGFNFNISHSGNWVICAVDQQNIGVDVEYIKSVNLNIAKKYFARDEYNYLMSKNKNNRLNHFYRIWTLKESYIKAVGKGLSIPLDSFSFQINDKDIKIITDNDSLSRFFLTEELDDKHILSVCTLRDYDNLNFRQLSIPELKNICKF